MSIKTFVKSLFVAGFLVVFAISLSGCDSKVELKDTELSAKGIALENYIPSDAVIVMTVNKQNPEQNAKLNKLGELFPTETVDKLYESIVEELQAELDDVDLNFEEDILTAFGENHKLLMAMVGDPETIEEDEMPDIYIAATLQNPDKMTETLEKLAGDEYELGQDFGATVLNNPSDDSYISLYRDTILITNKEKNQLAALNRIENNEESILNNEHYAVAKNQQPGSGFANMFINYDHYFDLINSLQDEDYPLKFKDNLGLGLFIEFYAEDDGVRMLSSASAEGDINFRDITFKEPYLYKGIPGKNLIMYSEVYDFKKIMEISFDLYEFNEDTSKEMRKTELLIKKTIGIDLKEDLLSFMDRGFAMVIQRNDSIVPAISFYIDATSNPEGAQKVIDILDSAIQQAYDGMIASAEPGIEVEKMVNKSVVKVGNSDMNRFSFDFSQMTDEELLAAGLPSGIFTEPIEFYYGLTTNNYFVVSTYSGLDKDFGDGFVSVGSTLEVEEGRQYLEDYPYNLSYISIEEGFNYIDQIFAAMELVEGPMDDEDREAYELVREFLAPIQYMIGGDQQLMSAGFLKFKVTDEEIVEEESDPEDLNSGREDRAQNERKE